jgi:hypothetical protein
MEIFSFKDGIDSLLGNPTASTPTSKVKSIREANALDSSWSRYGNDQTGTAVVDVVILISLYLDRKDNIRIKNDS